MAEATDYNCDPTCSPAFEAWLREWARVAKSDGCTGVADIHICCCFQHDHGYETGTDAYSVFMGAPRIVTRAEVDRQFRKCNEKESLFGKFSPVAWIRWLGVRIAGKFLWHPPHPPV